MDPYPSPPGANVARSRMATSGVIVASGRHLYAVKSRRRAIAGALFLAKMVTGRWPTLHHEKSATIPRAPTFGHVAEVWYRVQVAPTPGPPQVRSGRRLGSLPACTAARAFSRRIISSGMGLTSPHNCAKEGVGKARCQRVRRLLRLREARWKPFQRTTRPASRLCHGLSSTTRPARSAGASPGRGAAASPVTGTGVASAKGA